MGFYKFDAAQLKAKADCKASHFGLLPWHLLVNGARPSKLHQRRRVQPLVETKNNRDFSR